MRLIWSSNNHDKVEAFVQSLHAEELACHVESEKDLDWGSDAYGSTVFSVWIEDDDDIEKAREVLSQVQTSFSNSSQTPISPTSFDSPLRSFLQQKLRTSLRRESVPCAPTSFWTLTILLICVTLFAVDNYQHRQATTSETTTPTVHSPIRKRLLIDYPAALEKHDTRIEDKQQPETSSPPSYWGGLYTCLIVYLTGEKTIPPPSLDTSLFFEQIKQGELWRLISPIFLHGDIIHILFNMVWLIFLGSQLEQRLSSWRFLLLITVLAAVSNTAQYVVTGPYFLGFSGVICGMVGYIHSRQKRAPWEGFTLTPTTYSFVCFFIAMLAAVSVATFFFEWYLGTRIMVGFANTAHISGLGAGLWLGRRSLPTETVA